MRYYKEYNSENKLIAIGTGALNGIEITEEEYNALLSEIEEKAVLVEQLYKGEITIEDVPAEWQEDIQRQVDEIIAVNGEAAEQEATEEDYQAALAELGVSV